MIPFDPGDHWSYTESGAVALTDDFRRANANISDQHDLRRRGRALWLLLLVFV